MLHAPRSVEAFLGLTSSSLILDLVWLIASTGHWKNNEECID